MSISGRLKNDASCAINYLRPGPSHRRATNSVFVRLRSLVDLMPRLTFPVILFLTFSCLFVLIGCAGVKPPAPGLPPPVKTVESLKASGVVIVKKGISMAGRATVLVQRPGSFRIEVSGPFGQTIVLLISDGESFYIYSNGGEQTMRWDDPLMPYPIKAQELVSVLIGAADPATEDGVTQTRDAEGRVTGLKKAGPDGAPFEVTLDDYRITNGITLPFDIKLTRGIEELTIKYSDVEINAAIPPDAFQISDGK